MRHHIFPTSQKACQTVAADMVKFITANKRRCVLGLCTGSSPLGIYDELIRMHRACREENGNSLFENVVSFNLDEYYPMEPGNVHSYTYFMQENLFRDIAYTHHIPDGTLTEHIQQRCSDYERDIEAAGGIDYLLLGIGRTGHLGFNEPGSAFDTKTRLVYLHRDTRIDAASHFVGLENVPRQAITMGLGTIMKARKIVLLAFGENKSQICTRLLNVTQPNTEFPASVLYDHPNVDIFLDAGAAQMLDEVRKPWLTIQCGSPFELFLSQERNAVYRAVLTCAIENKISVSALTEEHFESSRLHMFVPRMRDYITDTLERLHKTQKVFNSSNSPVLIFSPHPDDDVICMGGAMRRFIQEGQEVHSVYMTSGIFGVSEHDVERYIDFMERFSNFKNVNGIVQRGDANTIRKIIRESEAAAACKLLGVSPHFLNLPFYHQSIHKRRKYSPNDVDAVKNIINTINPGVIFVAGDLSDPHGTHRVCLEIIKEALPESSFNREIYAYRGAWQEWEIHEIDVAIPLRHEHINMKRKAIFCHESQKDIPLFPGIDQREFWVRAEERNKRTAETFALLGGARYPAMEVFRRFLV